MGILRAGGYHRKKYSNSHYPTILLCVRKNNPTEYERRFYKSLKEYKIGLNNELIARIKTFTNVYETLGKISMQ